MTVCAGCHDQAKRGYAVPQSSRSAFVGFPPFANCELSDGAPVARIN